MAGLNLADLRRLANEFFTGRAGEAETAALGLELEADDGAALEFLALARAAREGLPAPAGLDAEAEAVLIQGVEALIASRARKPGLFNRLARRFRRRGGSPQASPVQAVPVSRPSVPALRPPPLAPAVPGRTKTDLEDTAPIAETPEPGSVPAGRSALADPPAFPSRLASPLAPPPPVPRTESRPSAASKAPGRPPRRVGLGAGLLLAVLLAVGLTVQGPTRFSRASWDRRLAPVRAALASCIPRTWAPWLAPARSAPVAGPMVSRPAPARPGPAPALPLREDAAPPVQAAPLPVELPRTTPVQAGVWN